MSCTLSQASLFELYILCSCRVNEPVDGGVDYSADRRMNSLGCYHGKDITSKTLPKRVSSIRDVEDALSRIASDSKADKCLRAKILWTPEERDETLTMRDVLTDYPTIV